MTVNWGLIFFRLWLAASSGWMLLVAFAEKDRITRLDTWFSFVVTPPLMVGAIGFVIFTLLRGLLRLR